MRLLGFVLCVGLRETPADMRGVRETSNDRQCRCRGWLAFGSCHVAHTRVGASAALLMCSCVSEAGKCDITSRTCKAVTALLAVVAVLAAGLLDCAHV